MTDAEWPRLGDQPNQQLGIAYEVHVDGLLSRPLLGYLGWSHRVQPEQSIVRLQANPNELDRYLELCSESGLTLERLTRPEPSP